ncbi:MAG: hypothetical protein ACOYJS_06615, partial [Acutalibacteraceae bacterium]
ACFHYSVNGDVLANGPYVSHDDGEHYVLSRAGFNGICVGGRYNWNPNHPNIMAIGSQDFNGGYTLDYGKTWKYVNWSRLGWGGFTYGSYMFNENDGFCCVSKTWEPTGEIRVTHDGGNTILDTGCIMKETAVACGVPGHEDIAFIGEWRTADRGYTFEKMDNCSAVFTFDEKTGRLYGKSGKSALVVSDDLGVTWNIIYDFPGTIYDIAVNSRDGYIHVIADNSGIKSEYYRGRTVDCPSFESRDYGSVEARSVCIDPVEPSIVYICCSCHKYDIDSVMRSMDDGETFTCLNRHPGDGRKGPAAGMCAGQGRVNPVTRELFVAGGCRGIWKISAPIR